MIFSLYLFCVQSNSSIFKKVLFVDFQSDILTWLLVASEKGTENEVESALDYAVLGGKYYAC
jgi:hypothetical protein